jgi:hypothetical protein
MPRRVALRTAGGDGSAVYDVLVAVSRKSSRGANVRRTTLRTSLRLVVTLVVVASAACFAKINDDLVGGSSVTFPHDASVESSTAHDATIDVQRDDRDAEDEPLPQGDAQIDAPITTIDAGIDAPADAFVADAGVDAPTYYQVVIADHPIAYYHLDEPSGQTTAVNSAPSFNGGTPSDLNGTYGSTVVHNAPSLIHIGSAATFNGTSGINSIVSVPVNSALQPSTAITLEAWVSFPSSPSNNVNAMAMGSDNACPYQSYAMQFTPSNIVQFFAGGPSCGNFSFPMSSTPMSVGVTNYVAITFNASTSVIYINSTSLDAGGGGLSYRAGQPFTIGNDSNGGQPFVGTIDEVAVYNYALTPAQIGTHYNAGK